MTIRGPFEPELKDLPSQIPIFPLKGALLLPGGTLPLNIFEPKYLAMVRDAIADPLRLIGMTQPNKDQLSHPYYSIGCAGRISSFSEQDDGRILITLSGCIRFSGTNFSESQSGYLTADVEWNKFKEDLFIDETPIDRTTLSAVLKQYFDAKGFQVDWSQLESCSDERLVSTLSMICPFDLAEKQALLEVQNLSSRAELLTTILQMSCHDDHADNAKH
tara:strand:- start:2815 stop:3468 length:654 start_codon:yes stop_codon:yes gene_type:complete